MQLVGGELSNLGKGKGGGGGLLVLFMCYYVLYLRELKDIVDL